MALIRGNTFFLMTGLKTVTASLFSICLCLNTQPSNSCYYYTLHSVTFDPPPPPLCVSVCACVCKLDLDMMEVIGRCKGACRRYHRSPLSFGFQLQSLYYVLCDTCVLPARKLPFALREKWTPPYFSLPLTHTCTPLLYYLPPGAALLWWLQQQAALWSLIICRIKPLCLVCLGPVCNLYADALSLTYMHG